MVRNASDRLGRAGPLLALALAATALFFLLALARPVDHDESQYVAAAVLAVHLLPYRDFAYLQTPLQPLLLAPLTLVAPGWSFVALRLANAVFGIGSVMLVALGIRRAGGGLRAALTGAGLYGCCGATLFVSGVARNDALPAMLEAAALALLAGRGNPRWRSGAAGMLLGLAAAAKISFACPAAAVMLFALWRPEKERLSASWLAGGLVVPALLVAALAAIAPSAFWFEVLKFPARAPTEWYQATRQGFRLGLRRPIDVVRGLAIGPALLACTFASCSAWRLRRERQPFATRLFVCATAAGAIAMYLPNPSYGQYQMPLLVPLFMWLGLLVDRERRLPARRWLWVAFAGVGLWASGAAVAKAVRSRTLVAIEVSRAAHVMGLALSDLPKDAMIGGLSPELYVDARHPIDPRFAAGPFVYRSEHLVGPEEVRRWHLLTRATVGQLTMNPPVAIIWGGERKKGPSAWLDASLGAAAMRLGYRERAVVGGLHVLVRPSAGAPPRIP